MFYFCSKFRNKMEHTRTSKGIKKFECDICRFKCSKKGDYNRHLETAIHKRNHCGTELTSNNIKSYSCDCGKIYKVKSGLWKHKKKCVQTNTLTIIEEKEREPTDNSIILGLISQNKELMEMLQEQNKIIQDIVPTIINNNKQ